MEDFDLCEKAQENLEKGVYFEGILNPNKEQGVSFCAYFLSSILLFSFLEPAFIAGYTAFTICRLEMKY